MSWVMVPVPEDIAPRVKLLLFQLGHRNDAGQWDDDLMDGHLRSLNPEARRLLSTVARRVRAGSTMEDVELAEQMAVSVREVFGIVREANAVTVAASPGDLLLLRVEDIEDGADGDTRTVVYMLEGLADLVCDREAALRPTGSRASAG